MIASWSYHQHSHVEESDSRVGVGGGTGGENGGRARVVRGGDGGTIAAPSGRFVQVVAVAPRVSRLGFGGFVAVGHRGGSGMMEGPVVVRWCGGDAASTAGNGRAMGRAGWDKARREVEEGERCDRAEGGTVEAAKAQGTGHALDGAPL
jgi:hypothetical protein